MLSAIRFAKNQNKRDYTLGLVSNGGVHSHINHIKAIVDTCKAEGLIDVLFMLLLMAVIVTQKVDSVSLLICKIT